MRIWKSQNPGHTVKAERQKLRNGTIQELPWIKILEDLPRQPQTLFGPTLPENNVMRGDTWINTAKIPHQMHRYTGQEWIPLPLESNSTFDDEYIDYLIQQLDNGRYDPELLSTNELDQITQRLHERNTKNL
jgi:hypothetical protein